MIADLEPRAQRGEEGPAPAEQRRAVVPQPRTTGSLPCRRGWALAHHVDVRKAGTVHICNGCSPPVPQGQHGKKTAPEPVRIRKTGRVRHCSDTRSGSAAVAVPLQLSWTRLSQQKCLPHAASPAFSARGGPPGLGGLGAVAHARDVRRHRAHAGVQPAAVDRAAEDEFLVRLREDALRAHLPPMPSSTDGRSKK